MPGGVSLQTITPVGKAGGQPAASGDTPRESGAPGGITASRAAAEDAYTPGTGAADPSLPAADPAAYEDLLERLRAWRDATAGERRIPRYCVLTAAVIEAIALHRPATLEQLLAIRGIGPAKAEQYGEAILGMVAGNPSSPRDGAGTARPG